MIINCNYCEKKYYICPTHFKRRNRHFCSNKCMGLWQKENRNFAWKDEWVKVCEYCRKKYRYKDGGGKRFCSQKCMGQYKHKKYSTLNKCFICDNVVSRPLWHKLKHKNKFCSRKCADIYHSIEIRGENNIKWNDRGASQKYPVEWQERLKDSIRQRDDYICRECGVHQDECDWKLDVHHVDYCKDNLDPKNLVSLCKSCHSKTNWNRIYWRKKYENRNS